MTELQVLQEIRDLLEAYKPPKEVMTIPEAATYSTLSESFLRKQIALKRLPVVVVPGDGTRGRKALRKETIDAFIAAHEVKTAADELRLRDQRRKTA